MTRVLNKIFITAIAMSAMTACNKDEHSSDNGYVNFSMGIVTTQSSRTSMADDSHTAAFTANDAVGIFVKDVASYSNIKYTTTDGTSWSGAAIKIPEGTEYTYYAYYPYMENATTSINYSVSTNQDAEGFIKNDFLYSTATSSENNVSLSYNHALSLVEVELVDFGVTEGATVEMLDIATDATIDLTAQSITTGTSKANITMDALETPLKYRAIIPAQTIAASTPVFRISAAGKTYQAQYSGEIKFEQGKYLSLKITLNENGEPEISINIDSNINEWTEGSGNEGDSTVEEIIVPLILPLGDQLTEVIKNFNLGSDTWVKFIEKVSYNSVATFDIQKDETTLWGKYASLQYTSILGDSLSNNSFFKAALSYYHASPLDMSKTTIYKLSMKIKTELSQSATKDGEPTLNGASKIAITCRNADNSSSFAASTNQNFTATSVGKTPTDNQWLDFTIYINFSKKSTTVGTVPASGEKSWVDTTSDDYSKFDLRFYTNNNASAEVQKVVSKIYISDLVMEPYISE
ncbi:fimbrillin family protein [Bacteroides caecigallinarum]|uniref:fimbrillin family protein n=1 Tax=Bacteroides caecigallinarum TaxID=1411144 RepID=UPI0019575F6C|nr:fimbrillin family protein [Bacteroides caecigallinarum]MBM6962101.1 fimbrillin family protein [Bacteroides caecigallinarum]